jgi:hypothetical protein
MIIAGLNGILRCMWIRKQLFELGSNPDVNMWACTDTLHTILTALYKRTSAALPGNCCEHVGPFALEIWWSLNKLLLLGA